MRVEVKTPESVIEPRLWAEHQQVLAMVLRPGSIEWGSRPSEMHRVDYSTGDMGVCRRYEGEWVGIREVASVDLVISDAALAAAHDGISDEVELRPQRKFVDARLRALVAAVNEERIAGFPSGRLFLDSIEQALAIVLVDGHAVRRGSLRTYRGGLGAASLRRIKELVDAKMADDLTLDELARSVELSTAHFARMFRKSIGETPHQFVLRHKVERAKAMLRVPNARVLDVALACGFKTQQHFAQVFRNVCGVSPTDYRRNF